MKVAAREPLSQGLAMRGMYYRFKRGSIVSSRQTRGSDAETRGRGDTGTER
ncbi:MAG: hypothetical protein V7641_676 [Blastocatellia bacterium]